MYTFRPGAGSLYNYSLTTTPVEARLCSCALSGSRSMNCYVPAATVASNAGRPSSKPHARQRMAPRPPRITRRRLQRPSPPCGALPGLHCASAFSTVGWRSFTKRGVGVRQKRERQECRSAGSAKADGIVIRGEYAMEKISACVIRGSHLRAGGAASTVLEGGLILESGECGPYWEARIPDAPGRALSEGEPERREAGGGRKRSGRGGTDQACAR